MKEKRIQYLALMVSLLLVLTSPVQQVAAQEGEIRESFDNESLPGWEYSQGVSISVGTL